jgi:hypothetical protein
MIKHRGVDIKIDEATRFVDDKTSVDGGDSMIYKAESEYGKSFAKNAPDAVDGAKEQIDRALDQ